MPDHESLQDTLERVIGEQPQEPSPDAPAQEPEQEPAAAEPSRERDEKGRFAHKQDQAEEKQDQADVKPKREPKRPVAAKAPDEPVEALGDAKQEQDEARPPAKMPPGFSIETKSIWETLPQHVRDDITNREARREAEVNAGFQRYAGLGKFAEEAERNGTSLQQAVQDYTSVETSLRRDFLGGIEYICARLGVEPSSLARAMATRYRIAATQDGQDEAPQDIRPPPPVDPMAIAAHVFNNVQQDMELKDSKTKVQAFAANPKNKYFEDVRLQMAHLLNIPNDGSQKKPETLEEAYEAACWLNPTIRSTLIKEAGDTKTKEAAAALSKSRNAAKAVGGAPSAGINPDATQKRRGLTLEETINAAIEDQLSAG